MITRAPASCSVRRLVLIQRPHACTVWRQTRRGGYGIIGRRPIRPRRELCSVEGRTLCIVTISGALTLYVSRGSRLDVPSSFPAPCHALGRSAGRLQKERWDRCLFPITPPVTRVLGGEASDALNAPALVRASGGGQCPCARRPSVRSSPLPYSMVVGACTLIDSLDAISVFEAKAVDRCAYARLGRRVEGFDIQIILFRCVSEGTPY